MTRRKFTPKFKTKVVLEALKERHSLAELAQKYEIHPTQISAWKRDFLDGAEQVFESGKKDARSETEREKDKLLKAIGS
ncbi:transposase [Allomuricauda taeanensis]|uniref:transposase n=1 Tax=Flagellimonas taeanensis TaxID=1005926 RepID=UPI002E7C4371|nr:transposase [Allomuricauda taeanensis]MEE1964125.1 transposase [Allomuricauda taeanensis]